MRLPKRFHRAARPCAGLLLVALLFAPGCARSGRRPVHPVRGRVLVQGRPAARAVVTFHPVSEAGPEALRPAGHADEQGNFSLSTYRGGDGAPAGQYRVTVQWFQAVRDPAQPGEYVSRNFLPARYAQAESSGLAATVAPGSNDLPPFEVQPR